MKYTCKGKVIIKSGYITSNEKYLQFLCQHFPSLNKTEDDESYFQNQYFLFATCAAHMTVLPTDQHFHTLMSDNKTPRKPQTKAVLRALYHQVWLKLPTGDSVAKGPGTSAKSSPGLCEGREPC